MKLSKEQLNEAFFHAARETCGDEELAYLDAMESLEADTLKIEGYERVEWTRFNPKDPKTFPPKNECLDVFEQHTKHKWRAVNMFTEFCWQRVVEEWSINVNSRGYTIYWRPLPPPPGKEEAR